jgi:hypothetical protein
MATYVNDLRLKEITTGDESGTWGTSTNTNLELIAEAFSYGTEVITTNADTHTTTIADGASDPGRALYLKYTGTLDSACTITIGPDTVSKVWIIENGTSGSQNIIISQGSGADITIPAGDTKVVYSDGAGAGAAFFDAFASLSVVDLKVQDDLTVTDDLIVNGDIDLEGNMDVNGSLETDALSLNGTTVTSTAAEINLLDGSSANTVVNSKAVIYGSSGEVAGTLSTAAQPNITSVGTLTGFTSTGIDDNATSTAITIDSSERVIVGNTSPFTADSVTIDQGGFLAIRNTSASGMEVRRDGTDGSLIDFQKDGTAIGSIASVLSGTEMYLAGLGANTSGIFFSGANSLLSMKAGTLADGTQDLGAGGYRFKDLYLSGNINLSAFSQINSSTAFYLDSDIIHFRRNNETESARIDSSGNLLVNTTGTIADYFPAQVQINAANNNGIVVKVTTAGENSFSSWNSIASGTRYHCNFYDGASRTLRGSITSNGSATAYNTSSDYRLKEDDVPMTGATERVKALRPINFAWKSDGSRVDGFLAHEAAEVVPECVTGTKDAMRDEKYEVTPAVEEVRDEDGNVTTEAVAAVMGTRSVPDYQGIDQSKLVPLLTAALQEAITKIEDLTTRLETLENA